MVSCKRPGCPKVYHADCLNLTKRPAGQCQIHASAFSNKKGRVLEPVPFRVLGTLEPARDPAQISPSSEQDRRYQGCLINGGRRPVQCATEVKCSRNMAARIDSHASRCLSDWSVSVLFLVAVLCYVSKRATPLLIFSHLSVPAGFRANFFLVGMLQKVRNLAGDPERTLGYSSLPTP